METQKRERSANFNAAEVQLLVSLVVKYKHIIENKKTDAVANKDKESAWKKIEHSFNSCGISPSARSWKTLKLKYEGIKKSTKKKSSLQRQEMYRTGGGPSNAPEFNDVEEKVLSICSNIKGMDARNDSDNITEPIAVEEVSLDKNFDTSQISFLDTTELCETWNTDQANVNIPDMNESMILEINEDDESKKALSWGDPAKSPVLMVHGKLDACSSFRPLVSLLPDDYFYVSIDLPGNGISDPLPRGIRYTAIDLVPSMTEVQNHFKWDKFALIGHSLGVLVGKYFDLAYPGCITKSVEVDPMPAYLSWEVDQIDSWYKIFYGQFYGDKYHKWNGEKENAPKYTLEEVEARFMKVRGLSKEATAHILERSLEPAGDGLYRITYDQRMKYVTIPLLTSSALQHIYTSSKTPTFVILSQNTINMGMYKTAPFIQDPKCWPNNNYKYIIVRGNHDVHIENPGCMAGEISKFLKLGNI